MKLNPEIFRKAAEYVLSDPCYGLGACFALSKVSKESAYYDSLYHEFLKQNFRIDSNSTSNYWFGDLAKEDYEVRATALLLCAEMCSDE